MADKTFTLVEARSMLPRLRVLLGRVREERAVLVALQPHVNLARARADLGGGSEYGCLYLAHAFSFAAALEAVEQTGVIVKDFRSGLIDFPFEHEGRVVYLCWKLDEDDLGWWHEIADGFAGRQPIEENFEKPN